MNKEHVNQPIILFDGVCNLCNSIVQFVIKRDPDGRFLFASLQSEAGQQLLRKNHLPTEDFNSFVLLDQGKVFRQSTAGLRVFKGLKGLWPLLYVLILFPKPIRDFVYRFFAKRRYNWFGKSEACMLPTPEIKKRFLN